MTDPASPDPTVLPRDNFRTVVAALITALTIGGWINALGRTPLRDALRAQTRLWWIEQVIAFALAVMCIGIILRIAIFFSVLSQPQFIQANSRGAQLGVDSAEITHRARDLQARFERRRRQMLPTFYGGLPTDCIIVGRFCESHPDLRDVVVPD